MKCQFEINCEGKKKKSDSKSSPSWRGGAVWAVVASETEGENREKLYGEGGWDEGTKRAVWEGGFSDVFWCVLGKGKKRKCCEKLGTEQQNPFYSPSKAAKCCTFSATGRWANHQPTHCKVPQEARVRRVNEPTFSIISLGVFMNEKINCLRQLRQVHGRAATSARRPVIKNIFPVRLYWLIIVRRRNPCQTAQWET